MQFTPIGWIVNNLVQANVDMLISRVSYYLGLKNLSFRFLPSIALRAPLKTALRCHTEPLLALDLRPNDSANIIHQKAFVKSFNNKNSII